MTESQKRKQQYFGKLIELLDQYPKLLIVGCNNVGSSHMQKIRKSLRGKAVLLMGKNTMIRKAIKGHLGKNPQLECLLPHIKENIGFVFTKADLNEIKDLLLQAKVPAAAKAGSIAPIDVLLPAGPTGLDPSQTSFMQALNIATRINKGQVEIINDVHIIKTGDKVGSSEATLLQKLNINPFSYGLIPIMVYDEGHAFPPSVLETKDSDILDKFVQGVQTIAALSVALNYPSTPALPHYLADGYRSVLAISLATDYTFERAQKLKDLLANPEALRAAQAAPVAAPAAAPVEEKKGKKEEKPVEKPKEEEPAAEDEEGGFGDLFG
jgi:large subunit ribosomal protein LP0